MIKTKRLYKSLIKKNSEKIYSKQIYKYFYTKRKYNYFKEFAAQNKSLPMVFCCFIY